MSYLQTMPTSHEHHDGASYAANPPLAILASALRSPLLPVIGFADLITAGAPAAEVQAWASEISTSSRQMLAILDCTLALAAGRTPPMVDSQTLAAAQDAVAALRQLLASAPSVAS